MRRYVSTVRGTRRHLLVLASALHRLAATDAVALPPETGARALCDAQVLPADAQPANADTHVGLPNRATRTIAPATRREVLRRDGDRCRVDGCANHTWLHLHHVVPRSEGGANTPEYS